MNGYHVLLLTAAAVSAGAAWTDWRTGQIPNWLSLGALILAPALHASSAAVTGQSPAEIGQAALASVLGAFACGLLPYVLLRREALGMGDVKLFAAVGALCRPVVGFHAETYAFMVGMVFALVVVVRRGRLRRTFANVAMLLRGSTNRPGAVAPPALAESMTSMRFAPSIFVGVCIAAALNWRGQ